MTGIVTKTTTWLATAAVAGLLLCSGCGGPDKPSGQAQTPPKKVTPPNPQPKKKPDPPVKKEPDRAAIWASHVEEAQGHLASGDLDAAEQALDKLASVYADPQQPSEEQQAERQKLLDELDAKRKAQVAQQREEQLAEAAKIIDEGKLEEVIRLLNAVRAASPTPDELVEAGKLEKEVERRREARRRLQTWIQLLGSETNSEVRSAQSQLAQDPGTALTLLIEAVRQADKPVLVNNAMELLRRLKRPDVALPAMVGVLERPEQQKNWPDAVREIGRVGEPGAGKLLLRLVLSAQSPEQRQFALEALTQVVDPPPESPLALLPMMYEDGPLLALVLQAAYHAVEVHGLFDLVAQRALDAEMSPEQEQQLLGLPQRLEQIAAAASDPQADGADAPAYWAKVLAVASRQLVPQALPGLKVANFGAEAEDGPAAAVLDGVWNTVDLATMWRYPVAQRGTIVIDLGEQRTVTGVQVWNFNEANGSQRGWKEVDVFVSDNPRALVPVASGIIPRAPGAADTPDYSTIIPIGFVRGRYVKLQAKSLWTSDTYTGLSEIQVLGF